jgi:tetratricopeptide (TPR) repeat protein
VERIPLALRLAARHARTIAKRRDGTARTPLTALLAELREWRLQVLHQGEDPRRPDLSVVVTFNASYDDLKDDQARLRRLGVFARNQFDLAALMAVWDDDERAARQALQRLMNAGLVEEMARDTWGMHDLLREYAAERLDPEEQKAARLAHAAYWQRYLDELELLGVDDWRKLEACRPEVEQAANWLLADWRAAPELAGDLAVAISESFQPYVLAQWEPWLTSGLAAAESAGQRNSARRLQRGLAACCMLRGDVNRAWELLEASLATARQLLEEAITEDEQEAAQRGVAVTLGDIARLKAQSGDVAGALALHQEELEIYERLGDVRERAVTLGDIARLKAQSGDVAGALALHQERLEIFERLGDVRERAVTLVDLADLRAASKEYDEAERLYREGLETLRQINDVESTYAVLARLGQLALARGRSDEALPLLQEARQGFARLGFTPWVAHLDQLLAQAGAQGLALDDLVAWVRAALRGDAEAGQRAWQVCEALIQSGEPIQAALGRGLQEVLAGLPPETALADLPDDLRAQVLEALND